VNSTCALGKLATRSGVDVLKYNQAKSKQQQQKKILSKTFKKKKITNQQKQKKRFKKVRNLVSGYK